MTCEQCGVEYAPRVAFQRFCNAGCERRWLYQNPKHPPATCGHCGKTFIPKEATRTKFCSRECAFAYKTAQADDWLHWYGSACVQCGTWIIAAGTKRRKFCSAECRAAHGLAKCNQWYRDVVAVNHKCVDCGEVIWGQGRKRCGPCAERQKREIHRLVNKPKGRARRAGVMYSGTSKRDVIRRYGTRCWICRAPIDMAVAVPHPKAITVDHVVPLALGGWHDLINMRPAHFACNCEKRDTYSGQLMLAAATPYGGLKV